MDAVSPTGHCRGYRTAHLTLGYKLPTSAHQSLLAILTGPNGLQAARILPQRTRNIWLKKPVSSVKGCQMYLADQGVLIGLVKLDQRKDLEAGVLELRAAADDSAADLGQWTP